MLLRVFVDFLFWGKGPRPSSEINGITACSYLSFHKYYELDRNIGRGPATKASSKPPAKAKR